MTNDGNSEVEEDKGRLIDYIYPDLFPYSDKKGIVKWSEDVMARTLAFLVDESQKVLDRLGELQPKCWFDGEELKCDWVHEEEEDE